MMTVPRGFAIGLLGTVAAASAIGSVTPTYRVRSVYNKENSEKRRELQDPFLTFSDDGAEREDEFFIDLFETPIQLNNSETPNAIQTAMNFFLLSELSAQFTSILTSVQSVTSEILSLATREEEVDDTATDGSVTRIGTEIRMRVYLLFRIKPSPEEEEARLMLQQVMSNLTYFVTNLTSSLSQSDGVNELSGVYDAIRREIPLPDNTTPGNNTAIEGGEQNPSGGASEVQIVPNNGSNVAWSAVPIILVVAVLVVLLVFLVFRRRNQSSDPDTPKNSAIMYMDVENELYSMDESVETSKSPGNMLTPDGGVSAQSSSIQFSMSGTDDDDESLTRGPGDSIFSGIETEYRNVRSSKSMMTGFTRASASTIQVSNHGRNKNRMSTTPKSYGANSSLFAFSEEGYDVEDSRDDHGAGILGKAPSLTKSDVSDTSDELLFTEDEREQESSRQQQTSPTGTDTSTSLEGAKISQPSSQEEDRQKCQESATQAAQDVALQKRQSWSGMPAVNSSHVLADLETLETNRRDPTPTMARNIGNNVASCREPISNGTVSYNIFNCNPVINDDHAMALNLPNAGVLASAVLDEASFTQSPTPKNAKDGRVDGAMPTPLLRNGGSKMGAENNGDTGAQKPGIASSAKSLVSGLFRSGRKSVSNPSTPSKSTAPWKSSGVASAPSSPNQQVGGHWMTSTYPNHGWRPSNSPKLVGDDDYDINLSRPSSPGDEVDHNLDFGKEDSYGYVTGYKKRVDTARPGKGRRHVGDQIGGDGSAMYQTSAMHPLDWSLKSADVNSIGDSTISEHEHVETGVPNQHIFTKGKTSIQTNGSLSPDMMESSKTPRSEGTRGSVTSRASASRQLINDLVWLEKKIAGVRQAPDSALGETTDSLSYVSNDNNEFRSVASRDSDDEEAPTVSTGQNNSVMSSIVCRDCYAPPGKLHIVIHSTKDGPAVHTVKEGSSLEGHIFPGDLIISVDNIDTRSYTAEQVMKMMASKGNKERKITVLHFEEE
ncbi:hypothetical protein IV203_004170 [Nitzschia inconspicua]|uniref:PDZ domain-containing protein n=1 Tax=Nitzschia inconspicua TaxID=303405 RepID=A0A9K3L389_9STRA|nr:hypothetical protein IV203_004170 [Nitzschia inconspicua]